MTDEQILDVIKSVCGFDSAGVERWRAEALIIGRAIEQASRRAALEEAAQRVMKIVGYPPREYYAEAILALTDGDKQ